MHVVLLLWYANLPAPIMQDITVPYPQAGMAWTQHDQYAGNYSCSEWGEKVWAVYRPMLPTEYQQPVQVAVACEMDL